MNHKKTIYFIVSLVILMSTHIASGMVTIESTGHIASDEIDSLNVQVGWSSRIGLILRKLGLEDYSSQIALLREIGVKTTKVWVTYDRPHHLYANTDLRIVLEYSNLVVINFCPDYMKGDWGESRGFVGEDLNSLLDICDQYSAKVVVSAFFETNYYFGQPYSGHPDFPFREFLSLVIETCHSRGYEAAIEIACPTGPLIEGIETYKHKGIAWGDIQVLIDEYVRSGADFISISYYPNPTLSNHVPEEWVENLRQILRYIKAVGGRPFVGEFGTVNDGVRGWYISMMDAMCREEGIPFCFYFALVHEEFGLYNKLNGKPSG